MEPRFCHRPSEEERKSLEGPPLEGLEIRVERPPSARRGLEGPPTRTGSLSADSLAKVRHSEASSMEWASRTRPHSEQTVSPAEWSNTTSVYLLHSGQYVSVITFLLAFLGFCKDCNHLSAIPPTFFFFFLQFLWLDFDFTSSSISCFAFILHISCISPCALWITHFFLGPFLLPF